MKNCSKKITFFSILLFCLSILSLQNLQSQFSYQINYFKEIFKLFQEINKIETLKLIPQ